MNARQITGLILCGGAASRLGGRDKGLLTFHGRALVDIAIGRLRPQVSGILISANRNINDYELRGYPVLRDASHQVDDPRYEGPLAGMLQGLAHCPTDWMCTIPCDCPSFAEDLVQILAVQSQGKPCFVKGHPSFSLLPKTLYANLAQALTEGQRKLGGWLQTVGALAIPLKDSDFRNLNTPEDFQ